MCLKNVPVERVLGDGANDFGTKDLLVRGHLKLLKIKDKKHRLRSTNKKYGFIHINVCTVLIFEYNGLFSLTKNNPFSADKVNNRSV